MGFRVLTVINGDDNTIIVKIAKGGWWTPQQTVCTYRIPKYGGG